MRKPYQVLLPIFLVCIATVAANAQSFRVQCPTGTITHPNAANNNSEPPYNGPTQFTRPSTGKAQWVVPTPDTVNGAIKCQQISGGDGLMTEADGTQTFMFSFGPLSGLADIAAGLPGSQFPAAFNTPYPGTLTRGDPATTDGATAGNAPWTGFNGTASTPNTVPFATAAAAFGGWNGAVGIAPDIADVVTITDLVEGSLLASATGGDVNATAPGCPTPAANTVTAFTDAPLNFTVGQSVTVNNANGAEGATTPPGYAGTWTVTCLASGATSPAGFTQYAFQYTDTQTGLADSVGNFLAATVSDPRGIDGHVDPRPIIDVGVMNGNIPAPLAAFDEDDEFFLTLTNVGMIMRPDLFEQHTVHFHGYPNASSFYDGVPDASVAINIGASFTYYYLAPDAGTYFWHCHITPPEHLQMGMVGQLYVRPRQDRLPSGANLYQALLAQNGLPNTFSTGLPDLRTACNPAADILCSATTPAINTGALRAAAGSLCGSPTTTSSGLTPDYVYNDGDGSTCYDVTYPIQMHGFDPNFHFVGMTFNPEMFVDMNDKYFLLNGRSYPDTVAAGPQATVATDGKMHYSQPLPAIINIPAGGRASLRLVNLSVAEYFTLQTLGIPMHVVGWNAKLLRDQAGNNTEYWANSITLGGGESNDVILDASDNGCGSVGCAAALYPAGSVFYLYEPDLFRLSNDAENFGGMMTEVHICHSVSSNTFGNTCN